MKTTIISTTFLLTALFFGLVPAMAATSGLIARWNLNSSSNNIAQDSSGNNLYGTDFGINLVNGKFGNAYDFSNNGYVRVANNSLLEPSIISVEAWVKNSSNPGAFKYILSKGALGDNNASYALYTGSTGGLFFYVSQGTNFILSPDAGSGIWDGNWHHIVGTYDGSTVRLYVDTTEIGSGTPTNISISYNLQDGNDFFIGSYNAALSHNFSGAIDEVRVWNKVLTPAQVINHAQSNSSSASDEIDTL